MGKGALEVRILCRLAGEGLREELGEQEAGITWGRGTKEPVLGRSGHTPGSWIPEGWMLRGLRGGAGVYPRSLTCRETRAQDGCDSGGHLGSWCYSPACSLSLPHHLLRVSGGPGLGEAFRRLGGEGTQRIPQTQSPELKKRGKVTQPKRGTVRPSGIRNPAS